MTFIALKRVLFPIFCLGQIILLLLSSSALADSEGGRENLFLLGVDARALGMGGAYVSVTEGASSVYWNPAGLALLDRGEASFLHVSLWENTYYDFLSAAYPTLDFGSFGVGAIRLGSSDIDRRDLNNLDLGSFDNTQMLYIISAASSFPFYTKGGLSFKIYNHSIAGNSATGIGLDLGILATPNPHFSWGVNLQDLLEPTLQLQNSKEKIPFNLKAGMSYNQNIGPLSILLATDIDQTRSRQIELHFGGEIGVENLVFLRGGYDRGYGTVGAGFKWNWVRADYALKGHPDLEETHRFSLTIQFGNSIEQRRLTKVETSRGQYELVSQKERDRRVQNFLNEGRQHEAKGDLVAALEAYNKILALEPQNKFALDKAEQLRQKLQKRAAQPAMELEKVSQSQISLNRAKELYQRGSYKLAHERVQEALKISPDNAEALKLQSEIKLSLANQVMSLEEEAKKSYNSGNVQQAILFWSRILELDSTNQSAVQGLKQADRQVRLNAHIKSGLEYFNAGNFSSAQREFYSALSISPNDPVATDYIQKVRAKLEKATTLEDIKQDPQIWQLYQLGLERYQKGDYQGAIQAWEEVLKVYPDNQNTLRNLEQARLRLK